MIDFDRFEIISSFSFFFFLVCVSVCLCVCVCLCHLCRLLFQVRLFQYYKKKVGGRSSSYFGIVSTSVFTAFRVDTGVDSAQTPSKRLDESPLFRVYGNRNVAADLFNKVLVSNIRLVADFISNWLHLTPGRAGAPLRSKPRHGGRAASHTLHVIC